MRIACALLLLGLFGALRATPATAQTTTTSTSTSTSTTTTLLLLGSPASGRPGVTGLGVLPAITGDGAQTTYVECDGAAALRYTFDTAAGTVDVTIQRSLNRGTSWAADGAATTVNTDEDAVATAPPSGWYRLSAATCSSCNTTPYYYCVTSP